MRRLPWVTHLLAAVGIFGFLVWNEISEYGYTAVDTDYPPQLMSVGILIAAWVIAFPAVVLEVAAARSDRWRWVGRVSAVVATVVLAWFGALPVGLRFFGSRDPVTQDEVYMAIGNYAVLLAGYLVLLVVLSRVFARQSGTQHLP